VSVYRRVAAWGCLLAAASIVLGVAGVVMALVEFADTEGTGPILTSRAGGGCWGSPWRSISPGQGRDSAVRSAGTVGIALRRARTERADRDSQSRSRSNGTTRPYCKRAEGAIISSVARWEETQARGGLAELYVRYAPEGIRLAYLLTGDRALAEDLVQEAFARFVGRLHYLREPEAFGGYLRTTIVNLSHSHFRHAKVERAYVERLAQTPERARTTNQELDEAMHEILLSLPKRQRSAIVLRFYEDLTDTQAAEIMRCRPGTVRSLVSRAMTTLRSELGRSVS
jgi:RNA polymerase sigma-70 factor (sigma-E family)